MLKTFLFALLRFQMDCQQPPHGMIQYISITPFSVISKSYTSKRKIRTRSLYFPLSASSSSGQPEGIDRKRESFICKSALYDLYLVLLGSPRRKNRRRIFQRQLKLCRRKYWICSMTWQCRRCKTKCQQKEQLL